MAADQPPEKKDLTSLIEHSKALEERGEAPPVPEGQVMEAQTIEKIDEFESLEKYAESNPPPPLSETPSETESAPPAEAPAETPSESVAPPTETPNMDSQFAPPAEGATEAPPSENQFEAAVEPPPAPQAENQFETSPASPAHEENQFTDLAPPSGEPSSSSENQFPSSGTDFPATSEAEAPPHGGDFGGVDSPQPGAAENPSAAADAGSAPSDFATTPPTEPISESAAPPAAMSEAPPEPVPPPAAAAPPPTPPPAPAPKATPIEKIRQFAEKVTPAKPNVPAAFPFSVKISGDLLPEEKEKISDLIIHENMGIRQVDLDPQLASGNVLVPRISEYAAIFLVQALRGIRAKITMGPSDMIFSTQDTRDENPATESEEIKVAYISDLDHPAENIPITSEDHLPEQLHRLIDTVSASTALKSDAIEAETTSEYQQIVEALQREIKYKAFRKGGNAIINFKIQLSMLSSPTHYRVTVLGTAVGATSQSTSNPGPEATQAAESSTSS